MSAHTPGPLFVRQEDKWPFQIEIVDGNGDVVFEERRYAYGTSQETVAEVLAGTCFEGEKRDMAVEVNARQVADAYLRAAAPELLAALKQAQKAIHELREQGAPVAYWDDVEAANIAAISKATGAA